jgi:periodic tryptophan protein 2
MNFKFSNLLGAPYRGGNVLLAGDKQLLTPVGNRVSLVDLSNSDTITLPFEQAHNITRIALSPNGVLLLTVDEQGRCLLANLPRRIVLHHLSFKGPVAAIKFSPDGQLIAAAVGKKVEVWRTPGLGKEFAPFQLVHSFTGAHDQVTCIDWSPDSRSVLTGCKDLTVRVYGLDRDPVHAYKPFTLTGHRDVVVGVFWSKEGQGAATGAYSVSRDGALFEWKLEPGQEMAGPSGQRRGEEETAEEGPEAAGRETGDGDSAEAGPSSSGQGPAAGGAPWDSRRRPRGRGNWTLEGKHFFHQAAKLTCADYHSGLNILVAGFSNGIFGLYQLPDFSTLHMLSVSKEKLTTVSFNSSGEWLAFGCSKLGQLLVWEWRSETYVLKQQGHYYDVNTLGYSGDGQLIATGADDAKLKVCVLHATRPCHCIWPLAGSSIA